MDLEYMMKRFLKIRGQVDVERHSHLVLILILYFLFLLPSLNEVSTFHSDERFYTDSAIYMIHHHDYLTPYYPDGDFRLNKPIVTYWALIISYALLGISFFSSRLPFLLAACATLWVTHKMALRLFGSRWQALLAVAILGSNIQFITSSLRATPDILQTLFLNLSLYGFIAIIFSHDNRLRNYLCAYIGAALAIETKGLLGIAPIAFVFIYIVVTKEPGRVEKLAHLPVMLLAAVAATAWYIAMYLQHGDGALGHFYQDQVGDRFSGPKYYILLNIKDYIWGVFRHFMPWSLMLVAGLGLCRKKIQSHISRHRSAVRFVLGWFALLLLIFMGANISRTRYLIPAYPLLSVLMASIFSVVWEDARIQGFWRWICGAACTLMAICGCLLVLSGMALHWKLLTAGAVLIIAAFWAMNFTVRNRSAFSPIIIGLCIVLVAASGHALVAPVFDFAPSRKVTACILQLPDIQQPVSVWLEKEHKFAGQLYLLSEGRIAAHRFSDVAVPENLGNHQLVVLTQKTKETLDLAQYEVTVCGAVNRSITMDALWRAFRSGGKEAFFMAMQEPLYLARRRLE